MIETTARVPTSEASNYVMKLCRHFAEMMELRLNERQGVIHFENAVATLTPSDDQLIVTILANDNQTIEELQSVVQTQLDQVSRSDAPLEFAWSPGSSLNLHAL